MFCNIKNLKLNNILFYFLLILIILAGGVLVKKHTNIYEGMEEKKSPLDKEIEREEKRMDNYDTTQFDDKLEKTKTLIDLQIKNHFYYDKSGPGFSNIGGLLHQKEILEKISGGGGMGSSITDKASNGWGLG